MYDLAKRSLAFTVATGGLLLTGTAYTPALAAVGLGVNQGPTQAQGVQNGAVSASAPVKAGPEGGAAKAEAGARQAGQTPQGVLALSVQHSDTPKPKPRAGGPSAGPGAAASSSTDHSGGILSGNTIQIPIDLGLDFCGNNVSALTVHDTAAGSNCESRDGSSATSSTSHSGGIGSGNTLQAPINVPILACGNTVSVLAVQDHTGGSNCGSPRGDRSGERSGKGSGGAAATSSTDHSGGVLSGNIIQVPLNAPVDACGNTVNAGVVRSTEHGSSCTNSAEGSAPTVPGAPAPGSGGASATAVSVHNGGIGSGSTVQLPINVPLKICGNSVDAGVIESSVHGGVCANPAGSATAVLGSTDNGGLASGNSLQTPIEVPANVCGNEVVAAAYELRDKNAACITNSTVGETPAGATAVNVSSHNGGILSGNSGQTPINVPANVCENNVTVGGVRDHQYGGECTTNGRGSTAIDISHHNGGVGSGNAVSAPIKAPLSACGNDVQAGAIEGHEGGATCTPAPEHMPSPPCNCTMSPPPPPPPPPTCTCKSTTPPPPPHSTMPPPPPHSTMPPPPPSSTMPPPPPHSTMPPPPPSSTMPPPPHSTMPPPPHSTMPPPPHSTMPPPPHSTMPPPPHKPPHTPPGTPPPGGGLAHTGADIGIALGVAGVALLGGLGLRAASRRREGE